MVVRSIKINKKECNPNILENCNVFVTDNSPSIIELTGCTMSIISFLATITCEQCTNIKRVSLEELFKQKKKNMLPSLGEGIIYMLSKLDINEKIVFIDNPGLDWLDMRTLLYFIEDSASVNIKLFVPSELFNRFQFSLNNVQLKHV